MTRLFLLRSFLLGVGLSMDALTVSMADGLREPGMSRRRMCAVAGTYGAFQAFMPLSGRGLTRLAVARFAWLERAIPWTGAALLFALGGKMVREGSRGAPDRDAYRLRRGVLLVQAFATSVDALSAGVTLAPYALFPALTAAGIIAAVTFFDCLAGLALGKRFGLLFSGRASVTGGCVLLAIGAETLYGALR